VGASELRSPLTGRVIEVPIAVGDSVTGRAVLITIAGTDDLRVDAEFSEAQARLLAVGQAASLRIAGVDYPGSVAVVAQQAHQSSALGGPAVRASLVFNDPPLGLRLGASVSIEVEIGRKDDALLLPRGAYLTTGGERLAYVVTGDEAERLTVVYGLIDGNKVEVRNGLTAGDRVITTSYEAFKEYASVKLASEGEIK
jgi:HlyD family secretion protein